MMSNDDSFSNIAPADPTKDIDPALKGADQIDPSKLKEASIGKEMLKKDKKQKPKTDHPIPQGKKDYNIDESIKSILDKENLPTGTM